MTPTLAQRIELWALDRLVPYARNPRTHSPEQVAQIAASITEFGFNNPILVDSAAGVIAGHGRLQAARKLGLTEVPVIVLDHLDENARRAFLIADNRLGELAGWDSEMLALELKGLADAGFDSTLAGFDQKEIDDYLASLELRDEPEAAETSGEEAIPEPPVDPVTKPGDLWLIGQHRLICGDCRDLETAARLFEGRKANVVITSPPYATQRQYDPASGFEPVPPEKYVAWFRDVAAAIESVLAAEGSYFLNIKAHADDGERHLYVMDLVLAHKRLWAWRLVDEFCWRKTDDGVPGGWNNRFKNAWEPIYHFSRDRKIKFRPREVGHWSDDCFDYSPDNPKSTSGSGLLGTGPRGAAADQGKNHAAWQTTRRNANDMEGRHGGLARPSNVIEAKTESSQGSHSAPFPRAIPEFFIKAYSDPGDVIFDPFSGSGTTLVTAGMLDRAGYGVEISPAYCDVIMRRMQETLKLQPVHASTGQPFQPNT
ncbi:DNA methyltransferase [uncultured Paludibaculum sp.]|uniref:site-specific DNA-methyltransferase n=1 Tax=uncultured Paludibaculum sp. TaxID=1765020 RepID=UPI002AAA6CC4|nr:DNA methyltransferase [uncultured Paludibaculum sp.]